MSRLCALNCLCIGTLLVVLTARAAGSEIPSDPLNEMRAAAEAIADVDPDSPRHTVREHASAPTAPAKAEDRTTLLHNAVRAEVEKEAQRDARLASSAGSKPTAAGNAAANSASEEVRGAAARAQEAKRNRELAAERGQSATAPGRLKQETRPEKLETTEKTSTRQLAR